MTTPNLAGKCVIVTGAGSGLGRAMTLALAGAGAAVLALDVDEARTKATEAEANRQGAKGRVLPHGCDVRKVESCAAAVDAARTRLGGLTGLVNCAGLGMGTIHERYYESDPVRFWRTDPERWQTLMDVNVRGPFLMARAAAPHMIEKRWGRIVNVTTSFNTMTRGANMPYGQSKAALEAATASWAEDLEGTGVSANVLVPGGAADTALIPASAPYDRARLIRPEVMMAPICWLMSAESDGVNGMRFIGQLWDPKLPAAEAARTAGAPAAWPQLAAEAAARGQQPIPAKARST